VDVSSGKEPPRQKGLALEVPEDVDVPIRALITLRDPDATVLEGPSVSVDVLAASPGLQEPVVTASIVSPPLEGSSTALATADLPARETHLAEPTAISSAIAPSSGDVAPPDSSPTVIVQPLEGMRPQEPIASSSAIATSLSGQVCFILFNYFSLSPALPCSSFFPPESEPFGAPCV
jgi:hypothetical protein